MGVEVIREARELLLRKRIDDLLDERERLTIFLQVAEEEKDRLIAEHARERKALRARVNDLERSRKMWRERYERRIREWLAAA